MAYEYHHCSISASYGQDRISRYINEELNKYAKKGWRLKHIKYDLDSKEIITIYLLLIRNTKYRVLE
jgi:hypothetical protein